MHKPKMELSLEGFSNSHIATMADSLELKERYYYNLENVCLQRLRQSKGLVNLMKF